MNPGLPLRLPMLFGGALFFGLAVLFLLAGLLMWLWNITITRIFSIREVSYWEAFRLIIIAHILLGGASFNFGAR